MVIARLSNGTLILGLSAENMKRLKEGKPISITSQSHPGSAKALNGLPRIGIMYGETEQAIADELRAGERGVQ